MRRRSSIWAIVTATASAQQRTPPRRLNVTAKRLARALRKGNTAQYFYGVCFAEGEGTPKNDAEAVKWYRKAAEQGLAQAQVELAICCQRGQGTAKNAQEGVKWLKKAAVQSDAEAQFRLGVCYYNGAGVGQNLSEALRWMRLAVQNGSGDAKQMLKKLGYA